MYFIIRIKFYEANATLKWIKWTGQYNCNNFVFLFTCLKIISITMCGWFSFYYFGAVKSVTVMLWQMPKNSSQKRLNIYI